MGIISFSPVLSLRLVPVSTRSPLICLDVCHWVSIYYMHTLALLVVFSGHCSFGWPSRIPLSYLILGIYSFISIFYVSILVPYDIHSVGQPKLIS